MHAIEMALESVDVRGPELAEWHQPGIYLLKRFSIQSIEATLCVDGGFHETGLAEHAQVLRHGGLRHAQLSLDLAD